MITGFRRLEVIRCFALVLIVAVLLGGASANAKVYKWVDENGKVHFGDQVEAGVEEKAEDISDEIARQNIDSGSSKALQEKKSIFKGKTSEEQALERRQQDQLDQHMSAYCQELSKQLEIIQGRVIFVNEDGSHEDKPEVERRKEERRVRAEWEESCQDF